MAINIECPKCNTKNSLSNNKCKCGYPIKKQPSKVYWIDYRINGKRKREKIGRSKLAAETRLAKIQTSLAEERYIDRDKNATQSIGSIIEWYLGLSNVKAQVSHRRTRISLDNIKRLLGKETRINQITLETMEQYLSIRSQEKSRKYPDKKITIATMNREIAAIRKALNEAVKFGIISSNPIKNFSQRKEDNIRERVLSDAEFEDLLKNAPEYMKPILLVAFYEPMRYDEILKLEWSEIDFKTEPGFIRLAAKRTKGKKDGRVIPLHPRVKDALQKLPSRFKGGRVFLKNKKPVYDIRKAFKDALIAAEIEDFLFHDFRHCAITNLRRAGNDIPTIMKISGHKTTSMFHRYNLVDENDVAKIMWKESEKKEDKAEQKNG